MLKNIDNKNKGITLIALVITIIVLLILAGVSISMLAGDNNILKRAGEAKDKTELESLKEEAKIVMSNRTIEKTTMGTNSKTLKQDLEAGIGNGEVEEITNYTDVYYVTKNGKTITVYANGEVVEGKVSIWKGATDIECPEFKKGENDIWNWYIYTAGQLKFLADFVNNGDGTTLPEGLTNYVTQAGYDPSTVTMSTDTTIYLMNNLDLGARPGEGTTDEEKWETNPDSLKWMPIGIDANNVQNKLGTFEGNNYSICGVYVNREESFNGIFGNSNSIQSLTIKDSYIQGIDGIGGIVGNAYENIKNCHNKNTKVNSKTEESSMSIVGGIVGMMRGDIEKCTNEGTIIGNGYYIGGIAGAINKSSIKMSECENLGTIKGGHVLGGIIGYVGKNEILIKDCINSGGIKGNNYVGGIVGFTSNSNTINKCNNNGVIEGKDYVGGIAGKTNDLNTINGCNNNGTIEGYEHVGGIVGYTANSSTISKCNNNGAIEGKDYVGGIAGYSYIASSIIECQNSGSVNGKGGTEGVGGIAGHVASVVKQCSNTGNVTGSGNKGIGGIVGRCVSKQGQDISLCYNSGEIKGDEDVGGISGVFGSSNADPEPKEYNCYNKGKVINTTNQSLAGGIAGKMSKGGKITNCYYLENIGVSQGLGGAANEEEYISQNEEAKSTNVDLKSYEEFIAWIEQQ